MHSVSPAEVAQFKERGYFIRRGLVEDELVDTAMEKVWEYLLESIALSDDGEWLVSPTDPLTWLDPQWCHAEPAPKSGFYEGRPKIVADRRTVKLHDLGHQRYIRDMSTNHRYIRGIAEQVLGRPLKTSERTRGVYALFPSVRGQQHPESAKLGPHTDRVCQQLNIAVYLADVEPQAGGFTIWPGSHQYMHDAHRFQSNWSPKEGFRDRVREALENTTPFEFIGSKGDVLFWHGRLIHSAGIHVKDTIRWAVFADFSHDRPVLNPDEHRRLGQYEWFKDTKLFRNDYPATDDMWRGWRLASNGRQLH